MRENFFVTHLKMSFEKLKSWGRLVSHQGHTAFRSVSGADFTSVMQSDSAICTKACCGLGMFLTSLTSLFIAVILMSILPVACFSVRLKQAIVRALTDLWDVVQKRMSMFTLWLQTLWKRVKK